MNPFADLDASPPLEMAQLTLAFVFLTSYAVTLGSFCTPRGRLHAAGIALVALTIFSATVTPWAMGIVWGALAVGGMGLFVALSMLISRVLGLDRPRAATAEPIDAGPAARRPVLAPVQSALTAPGRL